MGDLFERVDPAEVAKALGAEEVPWTLDRGIAVFLNRWTFNWRGERGVIEKELRELVAKARDEDMAEVCRNAGCQEIR